MAYWGSRRLSEAGVDVAVQPLFSSSGPAIRFAASVELRAPLAAAPSRLARGRIRRQIFDGLKGQDGVVVDQDHRTEDHVLDVLDDFTGTACLMACLPDRIAVRSRDYGRFDRIVAASRTAFRAISEGPGVLPSRTWLVPPPTDWGADTITEWPLSNEGPPVGVLAGALTLVKGVEALLNALKVLSDHHQPFRLLVLGDGPERTRLETYAQALGVEAHFAGGVTAWLPYMERADFMIAPQFEDGLGLDVDAAVSSGIPVIGVDLPAVRERLGKDYPARLVSEPTVMNLVDVLHLPLPPRSEGTSLALLRQRIDPWLEALGIKD